MFRKYGFLFTLLLGCAASAPPPDLTSTLRAVVSEANQAWIRAARTLDPQELAPLFVEDALSTHLEALEIGREDGFYIDSDLVELVFEDMTVEQGGHLARVSTREHWQSVSRRLGSGRCLVRSSRQDHRQIYHLRKTEGAWRVIKVDTPTNNPKSIREPCSK